MDCVLSFNNKSLQARKSRNDFTVNIFFIYSIAFQNSSVKYPDLGGTSTVIFWYRGIP